MTDDDRSLVAELLDPELSYTLGELCRACAVRAEFIEELVDFGIIEPRRMPSQRWVFPATSVRRVRATLRLNRDLGINLAGAALALELLEQIDTLETQLKRARRGDPL
jgi:chaperone modulatory protein CbpM